MPFNVDGHQRVYGDLLNNIQLAYWSSNIADGLDILTILLVAVATPLVCAFTIAVPTNPTSGEVTEISWTFTAKDPATFSLFLTNSTNAFDFKAIIAENLEK
ncbi:hypothetical protein B0H13DRAFT_2388827 [Mycena leptocephala]|nr:hypothetical protein B0H13DRAFT_2388827 [Mycena leptocephala]